jgi:hypothetical protein
MAAMTAATIRITLNVRIIPLFPLLPAARGPDSRLTGLYLPG